MGYISELRKHIGGRPIISVGATILVINDDMKILFQHRSDTLDWGLPGGALELNETLEEAAALVSFMKKQDLWLMNLT